MLNAPWYIFICFPALLTVVLVCLYVALKSLNPWIFALSVSAALHCPSSMSYAACCQEEGWERWVCMRLHNSTLTGLWPSVFTCKRHVLLGHPLLCSLTHTKKFCPHPAPHPFAVQIRPCSPPTPVFVRPSLTPHPLPDHWEWPVHSLSPGMNVTTLSFSLFHSC